MSYSILDSKQDLEAMLHGTTLNKVVSVNYLYNRAARDVLALVDPAETKRIVQVQNALYDKTYDYPCPVDLKGDRIVDVRPQVRRSLRDRFGQTYNEEFDLEKDWLLNGGLLTVQWNTAVKTLRLAKNLTPGTLLNGCDSLTQNGTWTASGTATNLTLDTLNYMEGNGALKFDISAGANPSSALLENSTMDPNDLTDMLNEGAVFAWAYFSEVTTLNSCTLRWGSSSSNYYERTVTVSQDATAFAIGWNLLRFDWNGATVVGSPDVTAINYLRFGISTDGTAETVFRLDAIIAKLGRIYEIEYYSKYIFRDAVTGAFQEGVTADSNLINLDTDSYNLLLYRIVYLAAQQIQAQSGSFDVTFFKNEWNEQLKRYQSKYKSEVIHPSQPYYRMTARRRYNWYGISGGPY